MNSKLYSNILYVFIGIYIASAFFILFNLNLGIGWDAGLTIKMTDNPAKQLPFNYYAHPNPANINQDQQEFVTWWSPGQFALPMLVKTLFGVNINRAIQLLTAICLLLSGTGVYKLYKLILIRKTNNLSPIVLPVLWLFTILQPFYWNSIFSYDGGGILLLAYCPWFIYWLVKKGGLHPLKMAIVILAAFFGFFLKSSFTSIFTGALAYLFLVNAININTSFKKQDFKKIVLIGIYLGAILFTYVLTIKYIFLSHNRSISDSSLGISLKPRIILFPFVAPMIGVFWMVYVNKTLYWILFALIVAPSYYFSFKNSSLSITYRYLLIAFLGSGIAFYAFLHFLNVDVSYELRHYTILIILFTPALLLTFWRMPFGKYVALIIICIYSTVNIYNYIITYANNASLPPPGTYSGLKCYYDKELVSQIHTLDNASANGKDIFYLSSGRPEFALEIKKNRVLLADNFVNFHFNNDARFKPTLYFGANTGNVYALYFNNQARQDSINFFSKFERYKSFKPLYQTKLYTIYQAVLSK